MADRYDFSEVSILLADTNRFMRATVALLLRSFGFKRIVECNDGAEALEQMQSQSTDIVICDAVMDRLGGLEFTQLVRQTPDTKYADVPIIMLTGHSEQFRVIRARDIGATEFLAKPVSADTLWKRLVHVIEEPRAFVNAPGFVGPDRRRRTASDYDGPERRSAATDPAPPQTEVPALVGDDTKPETPTGTMGAMS